MQIEELTVIVPTRNERRNIRAFLASLPDEVELIVVDASDDETPQLIRDIRPHATTVIQRPCNVVAARQIGAEAANTPWLLFTDADVIFSLTYFSDLARLDTSDPRLGAIYGAKKACDRFVAYHRWFTRAQGFFAALRIPAATGSNLLISRAAFRDAGGFDLRLTCNEDSEIAWRIQRRGYRTMFAPSLVVYACDHRRLERGVMRKVLHSSLRCFLLYFNLLPSRWRGRDWGYWSDASSARAPSQPR
ncbi:MAG: glycosyltransferase [Thermoflexales bacterium]|nr:glycosyltransferase [Thermoflexales bacterium]MDW8350310.1 glycosyltransferase [Anaerolineae bacterium]